MKSDKDFAKAICPACGHKFPLKCAGKNPSIEKVTDAIYRAQCPECGMRIRFHDRRYDTRNRGENRY